MPALKALRPAIKTKQSLPWNEMFGLTILIHYLMCISGGTGGLALEKAQSMIAKSVGKVRSHLFFKESHSLEY